MTPPFWFHLATACLFGASTAGVRKWTREGSIIEPVLVLLYFVAMTLVASIAGTTARAIAYSATKSIKEGVIHGIGAWGYHLFAAAYFEIPAVVVGWIVLATVRRGCFPANTTGDASNIHQGLLRDGWSCVTLFCWATLLSVVTAKIVDAYRCGGWWIPQNG